MADRLLWYGLTGTVGMGATTIASAVVGDPIPVVIPAIIAFGSIALHHVRQRDAGESDADQEATDADVEQAVGDAGRRDRGDVQGEAGDPLAGDDQGDDPIAAAFEGGRGKA